MSKQCKECLLEKDLSLFYKHPLTKDGKMGRCIECVLKGRKTEHEILLSRERDKKRYHTEHRRNYVFERAKKFAIDNPEKRSAELKLLSKIKGKNLRTNVCTHCGKHHNRTHFHHFDYSKPYVVVEVCTSCHANIHLGKIECDMTKAINAEF